MREQDFFERVTGVWLELHSLYEQSQQLSQQIAELEQQGFVNATIHIRKDTGGMELLHPMGSEYEVKTGRRREYVGTKPEAQEAGKARVERYKEWSRLKQKLQKVTSKQTSIERQLRQLELAARGEQHSFFSEMGTVELAARGEQHSFFSEMGTDSNSAAPGHVPNVRDISPRGVIDYFKQSPDLAFMADDVENLFKEKIHEERKESVKRKP